MNKLHGTIASSTEAELDLLQQALEAIDHLQAELDRERAAAHEPIAIIGAGCRYPGGITDPESLWRVVEGGIDAITAIPEDRWDVQRHMHPVAATPGKMYANRGGYLGDVKTFDAQFFGITPREAVFVDPQQRLLLETSYEAFESAGIAVDSLQGSRTGVFVGGPSPDFGYLMQNLSDEHSNIYQVNGTGQHASAGRVSYSFGLMGPSVAVDTACSTSLVAIHLACRSLRSGEVDLAIAGAVSILLGQYGAVLFSQGQLMAPDGFCKAFDASADGFVRSEGGGVLALKRLSDAQRDGDPIVAIIRGTAMNSDGRSVGITQPHGPAQEALVRMALEDAGLAPDDIDYVEAHGTGTPTGDPIEVEALANVLGEGRPADRPLLLGSIKTNIGHTEAASGVAGLLKVVGALRHEEIPASLHFKTPNPRIEWDKVPVRVASEPIAWPRRADRPRRAGISGFGFSGTNAHVIIEEAPQPAPRQPAAEPRLIPLSARSAAALMALAERHADYLAANPDAELADVALTLGAGREHMPVRAALIVDSVADLERGLRRIADGEIPEQASGDEAPRVAFLFTGQGAQYAGMGRGLYDSEPVFRAMIDRAAAVLDQVLDRPFLDVLFAADGVPSLLDETGYTQPALFAIECALAELWRSWGITPSVAVGHSIGEFSAAYIGGVFGFEDGLRLVAARGALMQALPRDGAMAAVFADEAQVAKALEGASDRLAIAGINGPEETVVSGDAIALAQVLSALKARGIESRQLDVSHAFHSPLLEPMLDAFEARAAQTPHALPQVTIVSNLTGAPFPDGTGPDAGYWRRHARAAVRFAPAMRALQDARIDILVEIGPSPVLLALAARAAPDVKWGTIASLRRGRDDRREMLAAVRDLYLRGATLDWQAMPGGRGGRRLALPTYAFQRKLHWIADNAASGKQRSEGTFHHLLGERLPGPGPAISFVNQISSESPAYLSQHMVFGTPIVPGAGLMEVMLAAGRAIGLKDAVVLEQVVFRSPVKLEPEETRQLHTELVPEGGGWKIVLRSASFPADPDSQEWIEHAQARITTVGSARANRALPASELRDRATSEISMPDYYAVCHTNGLDLGPPFQVIESEHVNGEGDVVARLALSPEFLTDMLVNIHPTMFDGALQTTGCLLRHEATQRVYIPIGVDEVVLHRPATQTMWVTTRIVDAAGDAMRSYDIRIEEPDGTLIATMTGLLTQAVTPASMGAGISTRTLTPQWRDAAGGGQAIAPKGLRLLIADKGGFATDLAEAIVERGGSAVVVDRAAFAAAVRDPAQNPALVIDCTALDRASGEPLADAQQRALDLIERARTLAAVAPALPLCIMTRGALSASPGDDVALFNAPLVGLSRTLATEQAMSPRLRVDLDPATAPDARLAMRALAGLSLEEPELAVRQGALLAPRLHEPVAAKPLDPQRRTALTIEDRGDFDGLRFEDLPRQPPAAHEVEVEVRAAGLNFRDLINALGMYPAPVPPLGSECAGIVTAVGSGITDLAVGDEVVAIAPESFASHCLCPRSMVARKPLSLGFAETATLPNAYLTAQLCLEVAGLKPGQRVLVHAAAGGVGSAVLRLAKLAGLEVFATAGNDTKRAFARDRGAVHVFDSRSLAFADQIMEVTNGEGVDCVINSLAGEFIEAGLRIIRPGGCFVEIGKQGLWTEEQVAAVAPGVRYRVEDLGAAAIETPDVVQANFVHIMALAEAGEIDPLPVEAFPLSAAKQAFRHMANARHIGKIVLVPDEWAPAFAVRGDGTYLVTGGLGGIGLKLVRWLVEQGAGHVVTLSRSGGAGHEALLDELGAGTTQVTAVACDVGDARAVEMLWRDVLPALPPLRGIFHAAGVLADAPLEDQDLARFERVRRPKMDGAWHLHAASARDPLDVFVMFSSTAALFGSAGQANYSAANAFLDGLAAYRRRRGLPATSIAWGPWAEVGMAAEMEAQRALWARGGIGMVEPADGIAAMAAILSSCAPNAAVAALDLRRVAQASGLAMQALLGVKVRASATVSGGIARPAASARLGTYKALGEDAPVEARREALQAYLHDEIARVLGFEASALEADTSLSRLGLDSLMAVQVRNTIAAQLDVDLPVKELLQGHSVIGLTGAVMDIMAGATEPAGDADREEAWEEGTL